MAIKYKTRFIRYDWNRERECVGCEGGFCFKPLELRGFVWREEQIDCPFYADNVGFGVKPALGRFFSFK